MIHKRHSLTLFTVLALTVCLAGAVAAQDMSSPAREVPAELAPADSALLFELGARGAQIYACEASPDDAAAFAWTLAGPDAELLNARGEVVGSHFAGPTWQGLDGSAVIAKVAARADAPASDAVPWLLLEATEHDASGAFSTVTHIQRIDTVGGVAPAMGCDEAHEGEDVRVPYEATYAFFYPAAPEA